MLLNNQGAGEQKRVMYHEKSYNRFMHRCKEFIYITNVTEFKYFWGGLYLAQVRFKLKTSLKYISNISQFNFLQF